MPRFQGDNLRRNLALVEELKAHAAAENCTPALLAHAWVLSRAPHIVLSCRSRAPAIATGSRKMPPRCR
jgi:aryl-alcohol dehydrogenase-like predicted oxidoreductase